MIGKLASLKVTGSSHGSSDYQKQVVEHVLQKPFTTLEAYYDFWARMEDASKNDEPGFVLEQGWSFQRLNLDSAWPRLVRPLPSSLSQPDPCDVRAFGSH